jgi:putative FmdB family regulatory protein
MASYSYKCPTCGHRFDAVAKMSDACPPCPAPVVSWQSWPDREGQVGLTQACGAIVEKVITGAAAVHFAGGGWAADGYSRGRT